MLEQVLNVCLRVAEGYFGLVKAASIQTSIWDEALIRLSQEGPLPPFHLRVRVHGTPSLTDFLNVGHRCAQNLHDALRQVGRSVSAFNDILDFGCGCGRTLRWMPEFAPNSRLYGTDIDFDAVAWAEHNLPFAKVSRNGPKDRLLHQGDSFDLIYAISVFTHMDEDHQFFWLEELRRVVRPGGIVLATLHGDEHWKSFFEPEAAELRKRGFMIVPTQMWSGVFPEWYQNTYHTQDYVLEKFSTYFDVLSYLPLALDGNQDIVVLHKPDNPPKDNAAAAKRT